LGGHAGIGWEVNIILYGMIGGIGEDKLLVGDGIVGRKIRGKEGYSFSTVR